jgi:hypothetical protein
MSERLEIKIDTTQAREALDNLAAHAADAMGAIDRKLVGLAGEGVVSVKGARVPPHGVYDYHEFADTARVCREIAQAMLEKRPLSVISMCDGESATLWAGKGFQTFNYLAGFGIDAVDFEQTAAELAAAISQTNIVGVPISGDAAKTPGYGPKLREALELWDVKLLPDALIADAMYPFYILFDMWLIGLLQGRRVLVVNCDADKVCAGLLGKEMAPPLRDEWQPGWMLVEAAHPILLYHGKAGTEKLLAEMRDLPFEPDICLFGGGARSAHMIVQIAAHHSIPVVEMGGALEVFWKPWAGYAEIRKHYLKEG